jgi:hypothetical protein
MPAVGRGYIDFERGVFHGRAVGAAETPKKQPPVRLPRRLLAHLERWKRLAEREGREMSTAWPVEWNGQPIAKVRKVLPQP